MLKKISYRLGIVLLLLLGLVLGLYLSQSQGQRETELIEGDIEAHLNISSAYVWFEQHCVEGNWSVIGDVREVYFNGIWQNERSANFQICKPAQEIPTLNFNRGAEFVRELRLPIAVILPAPILIGLCLLIPLVLAGLFLPQAYHIRFRNARYWLIILLIFSIFPFLRYAWIWATQPLELSAQAGTAQAQVQIERPALLFQDECIRGQWSVEGAEHISIDTQSVDITNASFEKCGASGHFMGLYLNFDSEGEAGAIALDFPVMFPFGLQVVIALLWLLTFYWLFGVHQFSNRQLAFLLAFTHILVAWVYIISQDLRIDTFWTWDSLMHTIPLEQMRENFWESILYLHMQPPLLNVLGHILDRLFGENMLVAMQTLFVVCGGVLVACSYLITEHLSKNRFLGIIVGLIMALLPATFVYENIIIYTMPTSCLVILSVYLLVRYQQKARIRYLLLYIFVLNVIVLFRSLYHIIILAPAIVVVIILAKEHWKRVLLISCLISLLAFGWYAKNSILFGRFVSSTWLGNIWWKVAAHDYEYPELGALYNEGVLSETWLYESESAYRLPSQFPASFDKTSDIPVLSGDNHNNINYPDIMDVFQANALNLIRHDPTHYLLNVRYAYGVHTLPPDVFASGVPLLPYHRMAFHHYLYGSGLAEDIARRLNWDDDVFSLGTMFYFYLMIIGISYALWAVIRNQIWPKRWLEYLRTDYVRGVMWGFIAYTTFMSIFFEMGENARYRYMTEHFQIIFIAVFLYQTGSWLWAKFKTRIS